MLRDTIERLEDQKSKLLLNVKGLVEKISQQKQDQSDIYFYLNKKLDDNYEIISALEEQLLTEQADRERAEKQYERIIEELKSKGLAEEQKLNSRIMDLEEKIQVLKDFSDQKQELDENLLQLYETLENERQQYKLSIEELERKAALDREKLKKEYESQLSLYRAEIEEKVEAKLSKVTKNTNIVNAAVKHELKYQSQVVEKVMEWSDRVLDGDKTLKMELSVAQSTESEMAIKLATYHRIVRELNLRITQEEEEKRALRLAMEHAVHEKVSPVSSIIELSVIILYLHRSRSFTGCKSRSPNSKNRCPKRMLSWYEILTDFLVL